MVILSTMEFLVSHQAEICKIKEKKKGLTLVEKHRGWGSLGYIRIFLDFFSVFKSTLKLFQYICIYI